ncbi:MAG TPA: hypothetical protein VJR89_35755, partial [Polyangiales bacterium]|nr:hypothetical protein [Polyangiales bacterium]
LACAAAPGRNGSERCEAIARCAAQNRCTGVRCYCGDLDAQACRRQPFAFGPCVSELRAAASGGDVVQLILQSLESASVDTALGRAMRLLQCRASSCARACRL